MLIAASLLGAIPACTNLDEKPTSTLSPSGFYHTEPEVQAGLAGVYTIMRDVSQDYWYISEATTDEIIVPTRGSDWFDNGRWLEFKHQTWEANSAAAQNNINGTWVTFFRGISRANTVLNSLQPNSVPNQAIYEAEARALRAYFYYVLMDAFGGVPIVTDVEVKPRAQNTRAEVFSFVESELLAVRGDLPYKWDGANYGRISRGAVDAILASLYLNAEVFSGNVTAAGLEKGTARWQDAANFCDSILNSGQYALATTPDQWRALFAPNNENSPETIFPAVFLAQPNIGLTFINRAVHYNHYKSPGGWNGFSMPSEVYDEFDAADRRRAPDVLLVGPQVSLETGQPINDRAGNPLNLTESINDITAAAENEGVRSVKFSFDPAHAAEHMGNDLPVFRLSEIYLIKAEALNELGRTAEAVDLVNTIRARVFNPPKPIAVSDQATVRAQIFQERLFELNNEGKRRQDMIREGIFTNAFQFKDQVQPYRILFPIPLRQLQTNPLLVQNPGY